MATVHTHTVAKRDLVEHFVYLAEHAGMETAERFLIQVDATLADLATYPSLGTELILFHAELAGMRKWPVKNFEKFLVLYLVRGGCVSIIRVLHAAQD